MPELTRLIDRVPPGTARLLVEGSRLGAWRDRPFTGAEYTERMRPGRIHRRLIERDRLRDEDRRR